MNWFKENRFLGAFFGVILVVVGVLLYFLLSAKASYESVQLTYQTKVNELNGLLGSEPFPEQENFKKMEGQRKDHQAAIAALQKDLNSRQYELESLTEAQFQERLQATVQRVSAKATEKGVTLPSGFFMGFDPYKTQPPRRAAAALLGREMKAMEWVVMQLLDARVTSLNSITRAALAEEKDKSLPGEQVAKGLLTKYPFEINFTGDQSAFRTVLNNIVATKVQFYIPRQIEVKNEKEKGPAVALPEATSPPPSPAASSAPVDPKLGAAPASAPEKPVAESLKYFVGEEKVTVTIGLEIIDFAKVVGK